MNEQEEKKKRLPIIDNYSHEKKNVITGFVDVALARDVQSTRKKSSRFMNMRSRLPTSSPIDIPKSKIARPERKERHFV